MAGRMANPGRRAAAHCTLLIGLILLPGEPPHPPQSHQNPALHVIINQGTELLRNVKLISYFRLSNEATAQRPWTNVQIPLHLFLAV